MNCDLTAGFTPVCGANRGGFEPYFYIGNWDKLAAASQSSDVDAALTSLSFETYGGLYKIETTQRNGFSINQEQIADSLTEEITGFLQTATIHLDAVKQANIAILNDLLKSKRSVIIAPSNNKTFYAYGLNAGGLFTGFAQNSGLNLTESPRDVLTWTANSEGYTRAEFFDTDFATTKATLEGYLL